MDEPRSEGEETSLPSVVAGQLHLTLDGADQIPWDRPADYEPPTDSATDAEPAWDRLSAGQPEMAAVGAVRVQPAWSTNESASDPDDSFAPVLEDVAPVVSRAWSNMVGMAGAEPPRQDAPTRNEWQSRPVEPSELSGRGLGPTPPESLFASRPSIWSAYDEPAPSDSGWDAPAGAAMTQSNPESSGAPRNADSASLSPPVDAGSRSTTIDIELPQSKSSGEADGGAPPPIVLSIEVAIVGDAARYIRPGDVQVRVLEATPWEDTAEAFPSHQDASWDMAPDLEDSIALLRETPAPPSFVSQGPDIPPAASFAPPTEAQPSPGPLFAEEASKASAPARGGALRRRIGAAIRIAVWTLTFGLLVIGLVAVFLRLMTGVL